MKFSLSWLEEHLTTPDTLASLCDKLTALGLEVEAVEDHGKKLAPFIIARIVEAVQHPNADRLRVCTVDTGHEKVQVVCGAPNARAGINIVLARPGDVMPDTGEMLKKGTIRGVESQGMICAVDELGIGTEHEGILELAADAPIGGSFANFAGHNDAVIEVNLTPNRPDCASVLGIARDLAAAGMGTLKPRDVSPAPSEGPGTVRVALDFASDTKACPFFVGRLIRNVKNKPSPEWLQRRLTAIGLRPISALVDITNYLTFDCGRPLHVFDAQKLRGHLRVCAAVGGETFEALNGKSYTLERGMTVICDDSGVISLGGIIGGAHTACDEHTTAVFVESALFDPVRTALTGRALQISSDARYRFERGVDPAFTEPGAELATKLIVQLCGTEATSVYDLERVGDLPAINRTIELNVKKCLKYTGVDVSGAEQEKILTSLGFVIDAAASTLRVTPPTWRPDIEGAADLVEEVIRVKGYDVLPITSLEPASSVTRAALDAVSVRFCRVRRALAGQGLMETITWSFMSAAHADAFGGTSQDLHLTNPISSDLNVMRPTILGNLIGAAQRNADRGFSDVAVFEIGPVFKDQTARGQSLVATTLRAGMTPRHWATPARNVDAYDAKTDALTALAAAGAPVSSLQITADAPSWYHPGRSGVLRLGPIVLATFGELHPSVQALYGVTGSMVGSEIFVSHVVAARSGTTAKALLKVETLQTVSRDFAFLVDREVTAARLIKAVKDADKTFIRDVTLFDVYQGDKMEADKKSVAISVTLQPADTTLTDVEIESIAAKITASVSKATGATLRG